MHLKHGYWCEKHWIFWDYTRVSNCGYAIANTGSVLFINKYFTTFMQKSVGFFQFLTIGLSTFLWNLASFCRQPNSYFDHWQIFTQETNILLPNANIYLASTGYSLEDWNCSWCPRSLFHSLDWHTNMILSSNGAVLQSSLHSGHKME